MPRKSGGADLEQRLSQAIVARLAEAKELAERNGNGTLIYLIEMALLEANERRRQ